MFDLIDKHDPIPDCDCANCARVARNKLRAFAQDIMRAWPEGGIDGFELQDAALRHGLLRATAPMRPCGDNCSCLEYYGEDEFRAGNVVCYQRTELLPPNTEAKPTREAGSA